MGTAFRQTIQLMLSAEATERHHLRPFCEEVVRACGSSDPRATGPCSALNSQWKRVAYTKTTLTLATAAWEGHRPASHKPPPSRQKPRHPCHFDLIFGGMARKEDNNQEWGDNLGYNRPNTLHHEANQRILTPQGAHGTQAPRAPAPVTAPMGPDMALLIITLLKGQSDAQVAQANANHANLIAFHTATAQALAAKGRDKESKLTAAKQQILQACAGMTHVNEFEVEPVYWDMEAKGGSLDALGQILRKHLKPIPLSPYKTNIHITPQLVATIKTFNFSTNGDKTYARCTKGITIFVVPWRIANAINKDLAKDDYFEVATLKSVADIQKYATSAKVELPTSLQGVVWVLNNYCWLLDVLFGPICPHLEHIMSIRDALEDHEAELELRLMSVLILHLMWHIHHDAQQLFLACKGWDDGEQLPHSTLHNTVRQLVDDCSIQLTLTCPEALFRGSSRKTPGSKLPATTLAARVTRPQLAVNTAIPPLCQMVVASFNRLYPSLTILDLCTQGKVKFKQIKIGKEGSCINFGLLGWCLGCKYRHKVCSVPDRWQ
jgi:hypothetical protein